MWRVPHGLHHDGREVCTRSDFTPSVLDEGRSIAQSWITCVLYPHHRFIDSLWSSPIKHTHSYTDMCHVLLFHCSIVIFVVFFSKGEWTYGFLIMKTECLAHFVRRWHTFLIPVKNKSIEWRYQILIESPAVSVTLRYFALRNVQHGKKVIPDVTRNRSVSFRFFVFLSHLPWIRFSFVSPFSFFYFVSDFDSLLSIVLTILYFF